jgi:hypothetical protein
MLLAASTTSSIDPLNKKSCFLVKLSYLPSSISLNPLIVSFYWKHILPLYPVNCSATENG